MRTGEAFEGVDKLLVLITTLFSLQGGHWRFGGICCLVMYQPWLLRSHTRNRSHTPLFTKVKKV